MKLYIIIAARRTGHHAIINWVDSILPGEGVIIEDVDWVYNKPLFVPIYQKDTITFLDHDIIKKPLSISNQKYCIFNIEERDLNYIKNNINQTKGWDDITLIINQRTFLNFLSSKLKHYAESAQKPLYNGIEKWAQYSQEIDNPTIFPNHIPILFDKWVQHREYRENIANKLGTDIKNEITHKVSDNGRGSSFDGLSYQDKAKQMDVLNRKAHLPDILVNQSIEEGYVELSNKIFNI